MTGAAFTREELAGRIERLRESIRELKLDGALILQRADLIYYTGAVFQGALAVSAKDGAILFVWRGRGLIGEEVPVEVRPVYSFGGLHEDLKQANLTAWKRIGMEEDVLPVSMYRRLMDKLWISGESVDISPVIRRQRSVKSKAELVRIRHSGQVLSLGFESLREIIREGLYEYEAQALMDIVMRGAGDQAGGRTRGFNAEARGVVACGASAAVPNAFDGPIGQPGRNPLAPMGAGNAQIKVGEPILVDHTAGVDGYMTDMTRTYAIGKLDSRFLEAHDFCVELHLQVMKRLVPGAVPAEIYEWALEEAKRAGYEENFMNRGESRVRFLGHGIGIEMDEWPVLARSFTDPLEENTILAVEPKIIYDDGGVGVEDTVIVTPKGGVSVTKMDLGIASAGLKSGQ
ncbi:MAG: Xaa-Pro peptidase family protein [bacterium]